MGIINISPRETPRDPSLQAYFKSICSYPLLTIDEEVKLFEKMKSASTDHERLKYREQIINSNLRFVVSVAKQYSSYKIPLMDLIQQGNIGLCKAVDKYDSTRGFKFISYAVRRIRQSISQYAMANKYDIKIPYNRLYIRSKIEKIISDFMQSKGYEPSSQEILDFYIENYSSNSNNMPKLDLKIIKSTIDEYDSILNLSTTVHLNSTITGDTTTEFYEIIEDKNTPKTDDFVIQESLKNTLNNIIETLSYEQKYIIKSTFSENPESASRIAEVLDIPISRVNTQKEKALKKIKCALLQTPDFADIRDYKKLEVKDYKNIPAANRKKPKKKIKNSSAKIYNKETTGKKEDAPSINKIENLIDTPKIDESSDKNADGGTISVNEPGIKIFLKKLTKALGFK